MKLSLQDIRRAFPDQDFKRGMEYYRQGRVHDLKCSGEDEKLVISCRVRGSEDYKLHIQEIGRGTLYAQCTCVRFDKMGTCKHLAAAMIAYVEDGDVIEIDVAGKRIGVIGIHGEKRSQAEVEREFKERKSSTQLKTFERKGVLKFLDV